MTEKPKRKIIPCPQCNCDEGLNWQIGLPSDCLQCPICGGIWDKESGELVIEPSLDGNIHALKYHVAKSFGLYKALDGLLWLIKQVQR